MKVVYAAVMVILGATAAFAQPSLPNPALTPGALNPEVNQENIHSTICLSGWARAVRPPEEYTDRLKRTSIAQYGYVDRHLSAYQFDHLVPLSLGGHPTAPQNLWPEPMIAPDTWRADDKDLLERVLNRLVCQGRLSLGAAQGAIATNWEDAYTAYVTGG